MMRLSDGRKKDAALGTDEHGMRPGWSRMKSVGNPHIAKCREPFARLPAVWRALLLGLCTLLLGSAALAQELSEADIKAGCCYNFMKFVDWPAQALAPNSPTITIGYLGENAVAASLRTLNGKSVKGKTIVVRPVANPRDAAGCQMVFVSATDTRARQVLDALRNTSVLTVGETPNFLQSGGIINLTREGSKIRFEINPDAATRAQLNISSQLLRLARIVRV